MFVSATTRKLLSAVRDLDGKDLVSFMVNSCKFDPGALERTLEQYEGKLGTPAERQGMAIRLGAFAPDLAAGIPVLRLPPPGPAEEDARALIVGLEPLEFLILTGQQAGYGALYAGKRTGLWKLLARVKGAMKDDIPGFTVLARVRWESRSPSVAFFSAGDRERAANAGVVNYRNRRVARKVDACPEWDRIGSCRKCARGLLAPDRPVRTLRHTCEYAYRRTFDDSTSAPAGARHPENDESREAAGTQEGGR